MDIETITITPSDNISEKLDEAREKSDSNNMPVLIKLIDRHGKSGRKDKAYLVSRDYFAEVIGKIYDVISSNSASFSEEEYDEQDNPDFDRLKGLINSLYDSSFGGKITVGSISNHKTVDVKIELFPAIDSKSSVSETIYLDESGQLDDISLEDQICLDNGLFHFLQTTQATYDIVLRPKAKAQKEEYKSAKNGKSCLRRIEYIETNIVINPWYKEKCFEKLAGKFDDLFSRRINGKDRYVYGILREQPRLITVFSVRGHYDNQKNW